MWKEDAEKAAEALRRCLPPEVSHLEWNVWSKSESGRPDECRAYCTTKLGDRATLQLWTTEPVKEKSHVYIQIVGPGGTSIGVNSQSNFLINGLAVARGKFAGVIAEHQAAMDVLCTCNLPKGIDRD